jgi:hypothetical protein
LHLAVTPADLRVGQGYVRCGRCERVFNALVALKEDLEVERQSGLAATGTTTLPAIEEPVTDANSATQPAKELPELEASAPEPNDDMDVVETLATGTFETIVLEGDGFLQTEEHVEASLVDEHLQAMADRMKADELAHVRAELSRVQHADEFVTLSGNESTSSPLPEAPESDLIAAALGVVQKKAHWGWKVAGTVLALLLVGQIGHHNRQALIATTWAAPLIGPIYSLFGVALEPDWDINAYDVRQLGGEALPGMVEKIALRASVHNKSPHSQPPPLLRVILQDRYGNALATHDIAPQEYLHGDSLSRLKPDQRVDAELHLDDPEKKAVGFELSACLPSADKTLHCTGQQ